MGRWVGPRQMVSEAAEPQHVAGCCLQRSRLDSWGGGRWSRSRTTPASACSVGLELFACCMASTHESIAQVGHRLRTAPHLSMLCSVVQQLAREP